MSLYNLVSLREQLLTSVVTNPVVEKMLDLRNNIAAIKTGLPLTAEQTAVIDQLTEQCEQTIDVIKNVDVNFKSHLDDLNQQISEVTHRLFSNTYRLEDQYNDDVSFVRDRWILTVDPDIDQIIQQRILLYTDWKYPALEIGCRDGDYTKYMIAADPLYLIDRSREFLESASSLFPQEYQRRLRTYHLVDHDLSALPKNQFAFIFSWGYFNYVSMDTMKSYLSQAYELLRPGGVFMFSYNDGDSPGGAGMAESMARAYTPKSVLLAVCEAMGYEIESIADQGPAISWLEIKKPGMLKTSKAHQVLGQIMRRET